MLVLRMLFRLLVFNYAIWDRRGWLIWLETGLLLVLPALTLSLLGLSAPLAVRLAYPAIVLFRAGLRAAPWESRYWLIGASGAGLAFSYVSFDYDINFVEAFAIMTAHYLAFFAGAAWIARWKA